MIRPRLGSTALRGLMDLHQLWTIVSTPDNVPIVLLLFVVPFYTWYGLRQAFANDRLIAQLEADPALAKTHHRKIQPWKPGWAKEVHVWPYLLRIEFLAAIIVTVHPDGLVDHAERAARRAVQSHPHHESRPRRPGTSSACRRCWSTSIRGWPAWSCRR